MGALNMTQIGDTLDPMRPDPNRRYRASRVTPFGARFAFEVIDCGDESPWIRAKINEAIVPLNQHQGCTKPRPDGLCPLTQFCNTCDTRSNLSTLTVHVTSMPPK